MNAQTAANAVGPARYQAGIQQVNAINQAASKPINMDGILQSARSQRRLGHSMWGKR